MSAWETMGWCICGAVTGVILYELARWVDRRRDGE